MGVTSHVRRVKSDSALNHETLVEAIATLCVRAPELRFEPPVTVERLFGGQSNLTFRVTDAADRRVVVRRGPFGNDMPQDPLREARLLVALHDVAVPTPRVLRLSDDAQEIGAPYFVMEHLPGATIRSRTDIEALSRSARGLVTSELARALAAIHAIDVRILGRDTRKRSRDYIHRQLDRWERDLAHERDPEGRRALDLAARLRGRAPSQRREALVHGDFRLDNVLVDSAGTVTGILDWELATIGDPDADAGLFLAYWHDDPRRPGALEDPPSLAPGLPSRSELAASYGAARGERIPDLGFFVAFGLWKIAVLQLSVRRRYAAGAYRGLALTVPSSERVASLLEQAEEHLVV